MTERHDPRYGFSILVCFDQVFLEKFHLSFPGGIVPAVVEKVNLSIKMNDMNETIIITEI